MNSSELGFIISPLPGTKGKTIEDQRNIDKTIAAGCKSKLLKPNQCDLQTVASRERRKELSNEAAHIH